MSCACSIDVDIQEPYETQCLETWRAFIPRRCEECGREIKPGEHYEYFVGREQMVRNSVQIITCSDCVSMRDAFFCSWIFGQTWDDLRHRIQDNDSISPDCVPLLTPRAREMFFDLVEEVWADLEDEDE